MIHRFIFLPFLITSIGGICGVLCFLEIELIFSPLRSLFISSGIYIDSWELNLSTVKASLFIGCFLGVALSPFALIWDCLKNRGAFCSNEEMATRLISNAVWLGRYTLVFATLNLCFYWAFLPLALKPSPLLMSLWEEGLSSAHIFCAGLGAFSYIWAVFYSLNTHQVLTPQVLMSKLRRSARLEN